MPQSETLQKIVANMETAIVGKRSVIELALITLLSDGHLLLEDVPGVGKTTLGKALAQSVACSFARIQFTPDTLPGDTAPAEPDQPKAGKTWEGVGTALLLIGKILLGATVSCFAIGGIVLALRSRKRRIYQAKGREDKVRCLMAHVLSFGTRYGMPIAAGETLLAYETRIRGSLDAEEMSFGQICGMYQSIRFGGKNPEKTDVETLEKYVKELESQYLKGCSIPRKIWYWCMG